MASFDTYNSVVPQDTILSNLSFTTNDTNEYVSPTEVGKALKLRIANDIFNILDAYYGAHGFITYNEERINAGLPVNMGSDAIVVWTKSKNDLLTIILVEGLKKLKKEESDAKVQVAIALNPVQD